MNLNNRIKDMKVGPNIVNSPTSQPSNDLSYKILNEILNSESKDRSEFIKKIQDKINDSKKVHGVATPVGA